MKAILQLLIITIITTTSVAKAQPASPGVKGKFAVSCSFKCSVYVNGTEVLSQSKGGVSESTEVELKDADRIVVQLQNNGIDPRHFQMLYVNTAGKKLEFQRHHYRIIPAMNAVTDFDPAEFKGWKQAVKESGRTNHDFPFKTSADPVWGESKVCYLGILMSREMLTGIK